MIHRRQLMRTGAAALAAAAAVGNERADATPENDAALAFTHIRPDGNRLVDGSGDLRAARVVDIRLGVEPAWVLGLPGRDPAIANWVVVLAGGGRSAFRSTGDQIEPLPISQRPAALQPDLPLIEAAGNDFGVVIAPPALHPSPLTPPLVVESGVAVIDQEGNLTLTRQGTPSGAWPRLPLAAPPDARLLTDGDGRIALLTGATDRYAHGVLGDGIEAAGYAIVDVTRGIVAHEVTLPPPAVIEALAPIWTDVDGDGERELVVPVSDPAEGARLTVFAEDGTLLAQGPEFGRGGRWRHPLAVAPFGPAGEVEIAAVRTPHIGAVVEFARRDGDRLVTVAELPGLTSHVLGSRNLDMAAAGDFDGDGYIELLVPTQDRTALAAVRRSAAGAEIAWSLPLDGALVTNLCAVSLPGSGIALAVGRADGIFRLWLPGPS